MPHLWAGIDAGKSHHHCVVINEAGDRLLSKKISNDETEILDLLAEVSGLADDTQISWATDMNRGGAALLISVLTAHDQQVTYLPGRTISAAAQTYRGNGKTDAKDAAIIADQARMRRDIHPLRQENELSSGLRMLCSHRIDLTADRTRTINRLRATLLEYFPALEAAFDYANTRAALVLLTQHNTAEGIRRTGTARLTAWLKKHRCRSAALVAERAVQAAQKQHHTVTGQETAATIVARLAADVVRLNAEIDDIEEQIETLFRQHHNADLLLSIPGFGPRARRRVHCLNRWRHHRLRKSRQTRRHRRTSTSPTRLRPYQRKPPPPQTLRPKAPPSLLPRSTNRRPDLPRLTHLLRTKTSRRKILQTSHPRPRPPTHQRHLGHPARPNPLQNPTPQPGHSPGRPRRVNQNTTNNNRRLPCHEPASRQGLQSRAFKQTGRPTGAQSPPVFPPLRPPIIAPSGSCVPSSRYLQTPLSNRSLQALRRLHSLKISVPERQEERSPKPPHPRQQSRTRKETSD